MTDNQRVLFRCAKTRCHRTDPCHEVGSRVVLRAVSRQPRGAEQPAPSDLGKLQVACLELRNVWLAQQRRDFNRPAIHLLRSSHGIRLLPRILRVEHETLRAVDGSTTRPRTVIWATGFKPAYDWLRLPIFRSNGRPEHTRGVTNIPGLYFLGLPWQHTRGSSLLGWVARDAAYILSRIRLQDGLREKRAARQLSVSG